MSQVAVGLSGGVDSAVACAILLEQGYQVTAFYIEAYNEPGCRTDQDKKDALKVALQLGVPFEVVDLREAYKREVTSYFYREYEAGRTPNPDVVCNREIKFGLFYNMMLSRGYDYVATGHYARVVTYQGQALLGRAKDTKKDQSYFLAQVPNAKLAKVIFPLGQMTKTQVREKARELGLVVSDKPDSMGICFVGEINVATLLRNKMGVKTGQVILEGMVVGEHQGIWTATVGERVGKSIALETKKLKAMGIDTTNMPSWYVTGKNVPDNQILIGGREECLRRTFELARLTSVYEVDMLQARIQNKQLSVRVRNLGELYPVARLVVQESGGVQVETGEPVFAPSPGQLAVLYLQEAVEQDCVVVGWGEIA